MACSFPPANVSWERDNSELKGIESENVSGNDFDCSQRFIVTGKIELVNLRYSDAGIYTCRAVNEYSMTEPPELDFRLRVHSKSLNAVIY